MRLALKKQIVKLIDALTNVVIGISPIENLLKWSTGRFRSWCDDTLTSFNWDHKLIMLVIASTIIYIILHIAWVSVQYGEIFHENVEIFLRAKGEWKYKCESKVPFYKCNKSFIVNWIWKKNKKKQQQKKQKKTTTTVNIQTTLTIFNTSAIQNDIRGTLEHSIWENIECSRDVEIFKEKYTYGDKFKEIY